MDKNRLVEQMEKALGFFGEDVATIRTGMAHPSLLENVQVVAYEGTAAMRLLELGTILVKDARTLSFQPWDIKLLGKIKNAIVAAQAGTNLTDDGQTVFLRLPDLTTEQREEYVRLLRRKLEGAREVVRRIRGEMRKSLQDLLQEKGLSEDEYHRQEEELQKVADEYSQKLEEVALRKEKEIRGEGSS